VVTHGGCFITGLANPAPIIQTFYLEPELADQLYIDAVVTLVDAKHAEQHINEVKPDGVVNEAVEQIAYADRIILNKVRTGLRCWMRNRSENRVKSE
jgi:G3E family GTPase